MSDTTTMRPPNPLIYDWINERAEERPDALAVLVHLPDELQAIGWALVCAIKDEVASLLGVESKSGCGVSSTAGWADCHMTVGDRPLTIYMTCDRVSALD